MIYLLLFSVWGAQTWCPFDSIIRARAPIFNLSQNDIYEKMLDSSF